MQLPEETKVYPGHEYTAGSAKFGGCFFSPFAPSSSHVLTLLSVFAFARLSPPSRRLRRAPQPVARFPPRCRQGWRLREQRLHDRRREEVERLRPDRQRGCPVRPTSLSSIFSLRGAKADTRWDWAHQVGDGQEGLGLGRGQAEGDEELVLGRLVLEDGCRRSDAMCTIT